MEEPQNSHIAPFTLVDKVILIHTLIINVNILDVFLYHIRNNKGNVFL